MFKRKLIDKNAILPIRGIYPQGGGLLLNWPLLDNIFPSRGDDKAATFDRASLGSWTDADGNLRMAYEDEARFEGAAWLGENGVPYSEDFTDSTTDWNDSAGGVGSERGLYIPASSGGYTIQNVYRPPSVGETYTLRWFARGTGRLRGFITRIGGTFEQSPTNISLDLTAEWQSAQVSITWQYNDHTGWYVRLDSNVDTNDLDAELYCMVFRNDGEYVKTLEYPRNGIKDSGSSKGILIEPQLANKCEVEGVNPVDLGWVVGAPILGGIDFDGDAAATFTVVTDTVELAAAGLDKICVANAVYKIDNSLGSINTHVAISGFNVNATAHTVSAYARVTQGTGEILDSSGIFKTDFTNTNYERVTASGVTSSGTRKLFMRALPNSIIYFILPQYEESSVVTSYIPSSTAGPTTRLKDDLKLPVADGVNFRQSEGMLFCDWTPFHSIGAGSRGYGICVVFEGASCFYTNDSGGSIYSYDGANATSVGFDGEGVLHGLGVRWGNNLQSFKNGADSNIASYRGEWRLGTDMIIGRNVKHPFCIKNIQVYKKDKGEAWAINKTAPGEEELLGHLGEILTDDVGSPLTE